MRRFLATDNPNFKTYYPLIVASILLLAFCLRIFGITHLELWLDEANSVLVANSSLQEIFARLSLDASPPLYYILLHYWMAVFGTSEFAVRLLSAVGGVLLVACIIRVGKSMFSLEIGLIAGLFMACSPVQVDFSQQARTVFLRG